MRLSFLSIIRSTSYALFVYFLAVGTIVFGQSTTLKYGSELTTVLNSSNESFATNATCANKQISLAPCSLVEGAIQNGTSTNGNDLYLWPQADSGLSKDYNLVEINGQCWFADNLQENPSQWPSPVNTWDNNSPHNGYGVYDYGVYTGVSRSDGYLYQFDAGTNNPAPASAPAERLQGVCPAGWHVATDCEFQYVEHSLGMTVADQQLVGTRSSGSVGTALLSGGASGLDMTLSGNRRYNTGFINGGSEGHIWTSECVVAGWPTGGCYKRVLYNTNGSVARIQSGNSLDSSHHAAGSIRCVQDGSDTPAQFTCPAGQIKTLAPGSAACVLRANVIGVQDTDFILTGYDNLVGSCTLSSVIPQAPQTASDSISVTAGTERTAWVQASPWPFQLDSIFTCPAGTTKTACEFTSGTGPLGEIVCSCYPEKIVKMNINITQATNTNSTITLGNGTEVANNTPFTIYANNTSQTDSAFFTGNTKNMGVRRDVDYIEFYTHDRLNYNIGGSLLGEITLEGAKILGIDAPYRRTASLAFESSNGDYVNQVDDYTAHFYSYFSEPGDKWKVYYEVPSDIPGNPEYICEVPGCGEGKYYCSAEETCKMAGETCGMFSCNNDAFCDANESCNCSDCNSAIDHCGMDTNGEQLSCTPDAIPNTQVITPANTCPAYLPSGVTYIPNTRPTTQGWSYINGIGTAKDDGGKLVWQVNDAGTSSGNNAVIYKKLTFDSMNSFLTSGGKYSLEIKNISASAPTSSASALLASYFELARGENITLNGSVKAPKRFTFVFGLDADKTPTVIGLTTNGTTYTTPTNSTYKYKIVGGANQYNTYDMVYDPVTDTVDLFVNGVERISNFPGNTVWPGYRTQIRGAIAATWGSGSSPGVAKTNYGDIDLTINNTSCIIPTPAVEQIGACCPRDTQWNSVEGACVSDKCAEGEYYCQVEGICKPAGETCQTVTCNNDNICDANESCDCADCNEQVDHCGLSDYGEQLICTKDTAPVCYTDKFPYCLPACLDGYEMNASGQCVVVVTPPPYTCRNFTYPTSDNVSVNASSYVANNSTAASDFCTSKGYASGTLISGGNVGSIPNVAFDVQCCGNVEATCQTFTNPAVGGGYVIVRPSSLGQFCRDNGYTEPFMKSWNMVGYVAIWGGLPGPGWYGNIDGGGALSLECCNLTTGGSTTVTTTPTAPSSNNITTYFGGMYGGPSYNNPLTGGQSCPTGYTATLISGTANVDYNLYVCTRPVSATGASPTQYAEFGGMWGTGGTLSSGVVAERGINAYTGTGSCPSGFTQYTVLGTPNLDYYMYYCMKSTGTTLPTRDFGGMWGTGLNIPGYSYKNPVTNTASCPVGYSVRTSWGTDILDWLFRWCYKPDNTSTLPGSQNFTYPVKNDGYVRNDAASVTQFCIEKGFTSGALVSSDSSGARKITWNGSVWTTTDQGGSYAKEVTCFGGSVQSFTCQTYTGNIQTHGGYLSIQPQSTTQFCQEAGYDFPQLTAQYDQSGSCRLWNGTSWYEDVACVAASGLQCCTNPVVTPPTTPTTPTSVDGVQIGACCPPGSAWNSDEDRCVPTTCGEGQFYCAAQKKCLAGGTTCDKTVCVDDGVCSGDESCQCADCVNGGEDDKDKCSIIDGKQAVCSDDNPNDNKPGACCIAPKKWDSTANAGVGACVECTNTQAPAELKAGVDQPYITCTGNGDATKTHFRYRITKNESTNPADVFVSEIFSNGTQVLHPTMTAGTYTVECFYGTAAAVDASTTAFPHSCTKTTVVSNTANGCSRIYPYKGSTLSDEMISTVAFDASFRCGSRQPVTGVISNPYMFRVGTSPFIYLPFDSLISELFNGLTIGPVSQQTNSYNFTTGNTDVSCAVKIGGGYSTNNACQLTACSGADCNTPQTFSVIHSGDLTCTSDATGTYRIGCNPDAPQAVQDACINWFRDAVNTRGTSVANGTKFTVDFTFNNTTPTTVECVKYAAGQMPGGLNLSDNVVCETTLNNGEQYQIYAADTNGRIDALQTNAKTVERDNEIPTLSDIKYYTDDTLTTEVPSTGWYNKPVIALAVCSDTPLTEATACACAPTVDPSTTDADLWSPGVPNTLIGADLMRYTRIITTSISATVGSPVTSVRIVDKAGNQSDIKNMTIALDTKAPVITTTETGAGATKTISLTVNDNDSKVWKTTTVPSGVSLPAGTTTNNANGIVYRIGPKANLANLVFDESCGIISPAFATLAETRQTGVGAIPSQVTTPAPIVINTSTQVLTYCVRDNAGNTTRGIYPVLADACFSATNMSTIPTLDTYKALTNTRFANTSLSMNEKYGYSFSENTANASCFRGILANNVTTLIANQLTPRTTTTLSNWTADRANILGSSTPNSNGYYYYNYSSSTNNTLDITVSPTGTGVKTVVVNGGNIRISTDINYKKTNSSDPEKTLILIARKNSAGQGGNIEISPSVAHIDAILIADGGAVKSTDTATPGPRLVIDGRIYSYNTRAGSLMTNATDLINATSPKKFTNSTLENAASLLESQQQDLERMRPIFTDGSDVCSLHLNYQVFTTSQLPAVLQRPSGYTGGSCGF